MLSLEERIKKFIKKNMELTQTELPKVCVTWERTYKEKGESHKEYVYYNATSGKMLSKAPNFVLLNASHQPYKGGYYRNSTKVGIGLPYFPGKQLLVSEGSYCRYIYCKYDSVLKIMEMSVATFDTHRYDRKATQNENKRKWERDELWSTLYFTQGDKTPYDKFGKQVMRFNFGYKGYSQWSKGSCSHFSDWLKQIKRMSLFPYSSKNFEKYSDGNLYGACGRILSSNYTYDIAYWFQRPSHASINGGKVSQTINYLCSLAYRDLSCILAESEFIPSDTDIVYIDLDCPEGWACLRYFFKLRNKGYDESYRVFVHENGKVILARKLNKKEWTISTNIGAGWRNSNGTIINFNDMYKHKRLSYIADMVKATSKSNRAIEDIVLILRNPVIEQFYKAGYINIYAKLTRSATIGSNIKDLFGKPNLKEHSLFAKFGLTKAQMDYIEHYHSGENSHSFYQEGYPSCYLKLVDVKNILNKSNLSDIDLESFKDILEIVDGLGSISYRNISSVFTLPLDFGYENDQCLDFWKKILRISNKVPTRRVIYGNYYGEHNPGNRVRGGFEQLAEMIRDTVNQNNYLPAYDRMELDFNNISTSADIERMHDTVVDVVNARRQAIKEKEDKEREAALKILDAKRKFLEYEDNDFIIRLPKNMNEISAEGCNLHHCVGGYCYRHADGSTTIMFLRRKDSPEKSFYTIEVNKSYRDANKDRVVQIHGFGNRWLGNDPDAIPFVMRWLKKNNILCEDKILLCTAIGYSCGDAKWVDKPEI